VVRHIVVNGELFNSLFLNDTTTHEHFMVDYTLWNHFKRALPEDYRMPDVTILDLIRGAS
jgi:hypothetical protein